MERLTIKDFEPTSELMKCMGGTVLLGMYEKLAHYEELEEAGRLVVLPDRKSRTLLSKALLNSDICPRNLGMEEIDPCTPDADCEVCWEAALEGGGQDE